MMALADRRTQDMHTRAELLAQLTHVAGQLIAPSAARAAAPLFDELFEIAAALDVPVTTRRDDSPVFIEAPVKIAGATWTQCGGVLHGLRQRRLGNASAIAAQVAQRILSLATAQH